MASVDSVLSGLTQMLQEHMAGAVKQLRVQVRLPLDTHTSSQAV